MNKILNLFNNRNVIKTPKLKAYLMIRREQHYINVYKGCYRVGKGILLSIPLVFSLCIGNKIFKKMLILYFKNNGYTLMKFGQWISSRPDLFPAIFCEPLLKLQDCAPEHSIKESKKILRKEVGSIPEVISLLDESPIGSGCVAQVYRGIYNGKLVAVKILHPDVRKNIETDYYILKNVFNLLSYFPIFRSFNLNEQLIQMKAEVYEQVNLYNEAINLNIFRKNFRHNKNILIPKPILYTQNVLIEEYIESTSILKYLKEGKISPEEKNKLANRGFEIFYKMIFKHKFVHTDIHAGNLYFKKNENALVLFDAGLCKYFNYKEYSNLVDLLWEIFYKKNGYKAASLLINRLSLNKNRVINEEEYKQKFNLYLKDFYKYKNEKTARKTFEKIVKLSNYHNVKFDSCYSNFIMSLVSLDGVLRQIDSNLNYNESFKKVFWQNVPILYLLKKSFTDG